LVTIFFSQRQVISSLYIIKEGKEERTKRLLQLLKTKAMRWYFGVTSSNAIINKDKTIKSKPTHKTKQKTKTQKERGSQHHLANIYFF